jgi:hypothetical protein
MRPPMLLILGILAGLAILGFVAFCVVAKAEREHDARQPYNY